MRDVQGLPGRTVAHALGLSSAAMKSRLHRARATLRHALAATDRTTDRTTDRAFDQSIDPSAGGD